MKVKKILWKYRPHHDGRCDIKIYVYHQGKQKNFSTGLAVLPDEWDDKEGAVKKIHPHARAYNAQVRKLYLELEDHFLQGGSFDTYGREEDQKSIITYCEQVIQRSEESLLPLTEGTLKSYRATLRRLREYCTHYHIADLSFNDIDLDLYQQFSSYLTKYAGCKLPGISKHVKIIKRLMNMGLEEKLHSNTVHRDPAFKRPRRRASSKIYLTTDEIAQLEQVDLSAQPTLERERDRFLLAYYFVMRFSDVVLIRREMLFKLNGKPYLRYQSTKTKVEATLPVKQSAMALMEKYGFDLSFSGNVQANRELKTIAAMAGINAHSSQDGRTGPKSIFVTTHTARRSAATNLYLEGVSLKMIADLGGWVDLQSLRTYLRASGLDTAVVAGDLEFFS